MPLMPSEDFIRIFGTYVPRLCVDTIVIGPNDKFKVVSVTEKLTPFFEFHAIDGVALKKRDETPRLGQWGLPGGTMFKGENPFNAASRIIKTELDVDIEPIGSVGYMWFPNENRSMRVGDTTQEFQIDSFSVVILARATSNIIRSKKDKEIGWFTCLPPVTVLMFLCISPRTTRSWAAVSKERRSIDRRLPVKVMLYFKASCGAIE